MKTNVRNIFTVGRKKGEVNTKPSMTVPGQSRTVDEWLKRLNQGYNLPNAGMVYTGEDVMPVMKDLTDLDTARSIIENIKSDGGSPADKKKGFGEKDKDNTGNGEGSSV